MTVRDIFIGPTGIRVGWRLAMFLLLFVAFQFVVIQHSLTSIASAIGFALFAIAFVGFNHLYPPKKENAGRIFPWGLR